MGYLVNSLRLLFEFQCSCLNVPEHRITDEFTNAQCQLNMASVKLAVYMGESTNYVYK